MGGACGTRGRRDEMCTPFETEGFERPLDVLNISGTLVVIAMFCHIGQRSSAITDHARLQSLQCVSSLCAETL
jgi:hypothetical protein